MTITISNPQGRAPGLYDEQLQRQQQEKSLFGRFGPGSGGGRLGRGAEAKRIRAAQDGVEG